MNTLDVTKFGVQELDHKEMVEIEGGGNILKDYVIGKALDLLVEAGMWILDGGNHVAAPEQPLVTQHNTRVVLY